MNEGQNLDLPSVIQNNELWRNLYFQGPQPTLIASLDDIIYDINLAARKFLNVGEENINAKSLSDLLDRIDKNNRSMVRVQKTFIQIEQQDFSIIYLQDIREQKFFERMLSFFATTLKSLDVTFNPTNNDSPMLPETARLAVKEMCDWCCISLLKDSEVKVVAIASADPELEKFSDEVTQFRHDPNDPCGPLKAIRSGTAIFKSCFKDQLLTGHPQNLFSLSLYHKMDLHSLIVLPIKTTENVIGAITFARSGCGFSFDNIDLIMAEEFASKLGLNIERAQLYKSLAEMKNAADAANQAKTNFLANVSHEIRTPIGAIIGFSELLLTSNQSQQDRLAWGAKIRNNSNHLLRLIDDILDLSKVEAGKLSIEINRVDLKKLLSDVYSAAKERASEKTIKLEFNLAQPMPRYIFSDETRLAQILINIVGNAIKFTNEGYVKLRVGWFSFIFPEFKPSPTSPDLICFEVSDTGIGVSEEQISNLFLPFSQADASYTRLFGGTGLGLALSRNLARELGGDLILCKSELGKGSIFKILVNPGKINKQQIFKDLAFDYRPPVQETAEDQSLSLENVKILLVEDSIDIQFLVKRFLEGAGATVKLAMNGEEGIKAVHSESFNIILMDVQMPIKDGYEATKELRASGYKGLIVALTAHAMKEEHNRCLEAGFSAHFSKPVRRKDLIFNITRLLSSQIGK